MSKEIVKKIWPEWELDAKPLGSGSYGTVYRAVRRDNGVESTAAIKVISVPLNTSEIDSLRSEGLDENATRTHLKNVVDDYVREIKLMESMKGMQNIVSIEDYKVIEKEDEIGWYILIRMELLTPLNTYLCDKTFSETEAIKLGIDICSALEICAKSNIIHRDIKPENIFVNAYGYFKLGDFGIAKQFESMTGSLSQNRGTYYYMAPEVAKGTDYDVRADIYSLGIVLYRLLNKNHLPFLETEKQLTNPLEREKAVNRRINGELLPPPSEASPATADLILWACEPDPANRISSAAEFKKLLISAGNGNYVPRNKDFNATVSVRRAPDVLNGTVTVRRAEPAQKTDEVGSFGQKPKKKGTGLTIAVIALLVVLIAVGAFFGISALKGNDSKSGTIGNPVTDSDVQPEEETTDDVNASDTQSEKESENNAVYSDADEEKIQAILTEAEQLAASEDYENACAKISAGLVTYPKSEELKAKSEEYGELLAKQVKEKTLAEADALAESGDFEAAIAVIEEAQKDNKNDTDYKEAIEKYTSANHSKLVDEALASADALAQSEDYLTALSTLKESEASLGKDERFDSKISEYEKLYVNQVLEQASSFANIHDYQNALSVIETAKNKYGNDESFDVAYEKYSKEYMQYLHDHEEARLEKLIQKYIGKYNGGSYRNCEIEIVEVTSREDITAIFSFYPFETQGNNWFGSYKLKGKVTREMSDGSMLISLSGTEWIVKPGNFGMLDFELKVNPEVTKITCEDYDLIAIAEGATNQFEHNNIEKVYSGTYMTGWGVTCLDLEITYCDPNTGNLEAIFSFYPHEHNPNIPTGKFSMLGTIIFEYPDGRLKIYLKGYEWLVAPKDNVSMIEFFATINSSQDHLTSDSYQINLTEKEF